MRRSRVTPGHFFVELSKNSQASIVGLQIREGLEPDPELVAAAENSTGPTPGGGGPGMMPPGLSVPMGPMFGPGQTRSWP
jgi:hypothetical protein